MYEDKVKISYSNSNLSNYSIRVQDVVTYNTVEEFTVAKEEWPYTLEELKKTYPNRDLCFFDYWGK